MKKAILIIGSIACLFFISCTTVGKATTAESETARNQTPSNGKALIYITRIAGYGGAIITSAIHIDTTWIGATGGKSFVFGETDPGSHTIYITGGEKKYSLPVSLEPNKIYYFRQNIEMGFLIARFSLKPLSEADGKKDLKKCPLSAKRPLSSK